MIGVVSSGAVHKGRIANLRVERWRSDGHLRLFTIVTQATLFAYHFFLYNIDATVEGNCVELDRAVVDIDEFCGWDILTVPVGRHDSLVGISRHCFVHGELTWVLRRGFLWR